MVSSGSVPASDRQKQPFELPTVIKGAAGSMRGPPGLGAGRPQQPRSIYLQQTCLVTTVDNYWDVSTELN